MKLLLDTHVLLWWSFGGKTLDEGVTSALTSERNQVIVSAATFWEIAIKTKLGKLKIPMPLADFIEQCRKRTRLQFLAVTPEHAARLASLPDHHRDPFDRMLAAQSIEENCHLVTADEDLMRYPVRAVRVRK